MWNEKHMTKLEGLLAQAQAAGGAARTMDLLYPSEDDTVIIGRQRNIRFEIKRWGW